MLQVVELKQQGDIHSYDYLHELGCGQAIERAMAKEVGIKVFVVYQPMSKQYRHRLEFGSEDIDLFRDAVKEWYGGGCTDMTVCHVGEPIMRDRDMDDLCAIETKTG